jgi:hypothetical protein
MDTNLLGNVSADGQIDLIGIEVSPSTIEIFYSLLEEVHEGYKESTYFEESPKKCYCHRLLN